MIFIFLYIFLAGFAASSQVQYNLEGYVFEAGTTLPVAGATIRAGEDLKSVSDEKGYFNLRVLQERQQLTITHIAFDTLKTSAEAGGDRQVRFELTRKSSLIEEVSVVARNNSVRKIAPSSQTLTKAEIEKLPAFLGQHDPLKALQTLPGSANGGEGNSGIYVRGGTSGQNLTLFNDAIVYNSSHLLGFFSVFNSTAVNEIKLYKSGIPAEFGGRLSSIIEINSSKQIADSLSGSIEVSPLAASGNLTVPITSFWSLSASARKTYMNQTVWPLLSSFGLSSRTFNNLRYDFYDLNLNSNLQIGKKNYLYFSAYTGGDDFSFRARIDISNGMSWSNRVSSLTWKSTPWPNTVITTTASHSGYNFDFGLQQDNLVAGITSRIKDYSLKSSLAIYLNRHYIKAGIYFTDHNFRPNTPSIESSGLTYDLGIPNTYNTDESAIHLSDEISISERTGMYVGARLTLYRHRGPYTFTSENNTVEEFRKNAVVSSLLFLEPSLTLRHNLTDQSSVKLSYSRNVQPTHLISVTAVNFPADFWMPTLNSMPAEVGHQLSLGYFRNFGSKYESYVDVYYKSMKGLVEFSGGIMNLIDNLKIEENLFYGTGSSYGVEFFVKRRTGKLTGWVGYTLAKSTRSFGAINNGLSFPAKYDRRHDLSLVSSYALSKRWDVSALLTYATGSAFTSPTSRYLIGGNVVNEYGAFNGSRMPAYHRLDFSATYKSRLKKGLRAELNLSIYNIYSRKNPIYIYFQADGNIKQQRISVSPKSVALLPVLPSISYKVLF